MKFYFCSYVEDSLSQLNAPYHCKQPWLVSEWSYGDHFAGNLLYLFGRYNIIFIPTLGGFLVSLLRSRKQELGGGLNEIIEQVKQGKPVNLSRLFFKNAAAVVTLGTGCSLGPEGPSVEIGAAVSRLFSNWFRLSSEKQLWVLATGAAAGFAAGFNAPIAGVFFALEIVLGSSVIRNGLDATGNSTVAMLLLSSALSALVSQAGLGSSPAFSLPKYEILSPIVELPLYLLLGLLAGVASLGLKYSLQWGSNFFQGKLSISEWMKAVPTVTKPFLGGLLNGLIALFFPQILFFGYDTLDALLADSDFPLQLLFTLLFLKPIVTSLSLGSGLVGGTFAPTLFVGATLGACYAKLLAQIDYGILHVMNQSFGSWLSSGMSSILLIAGPPAYSMVGMAAVLSGVFRAPLTSSLLLFELTRDYRIVLPLMASSGLSSWLVETVELEFSKRWNAKEWNNTTSREGIKENYEKRDKMEQLKDSEEDDLPKRDEKGRLWNSVDINTPSFELGQSLSTEEQRLMQLISVRNALNNNFVLLHANMRLMDAVHYLIQRDEMFGIVVVSNLGKDEVIVLKEIEGVFSLNDISFGFFSMVQSDHITLQGMENEGRMLDAMNPTILSDSAISFQVWNENLSHFCSQPWIYVEDTDSLATAYHQLILHGIERVLVIEHETEQLMGWIDGTSIRKAFTMQLCKWVSRRLNSK
ncbi:Chloride channel protein CLC-e [Galdieria sulphuraria]|nr:Chloride channel protein CLC-e [Galdieria sulphuraria]